MHMTISEAAAEQLEQRRGDRPGTLRLVYDTEGCGCAVNGVPALWMTDIPASGDVSVAGEPMDVWMEPQHIIYFEDEIKLDYRPQTRSFRLYSDSQTYNSLVQVIDRRARTS